MRTNDATRPRETAPIAILGAPDDAQVAAVADALRELGHEPVIVDTLAFPDGPLVDLGERLDDVTVDGRPLGRPGAVYLRALHVSPVAFGVDVETEMETAWRRTIMGFREKAELLSGLVRRWELSGVPIFNAPSASDRTRKPLQLALLERAGLPVPRTLWSNDPATVRAFTERGRVICKPVAGGAATRELTPADLEPARLERLAAAPVTFQELLPGLDVRVTVLDGEVVAAYEIESTAVDFRQNETRLELFDPAPELSGLCVRAADLFGLRFTSIDLKQDDEGRLRILELNDSPMFTGFDARAGSDVARALAAALARAAGPG